MKTGEEETMAVTGEEETMAVTGEEEPMAEVKTGEEVGVAMLKGEQLLWTYGKLSACFGQVFEEGLFNFVIN